MPLKARSVMPKTPQKGAASGVNSNVSEQIARLQQRQLEMVQQTTQELENLKIQLEKSEHVETLESEVARLRSEREALQQSLQEAQGQLVSQQEKSTQAVGTLTGIIQTHLKSVQGFAQDTEHYLERLPLLAQPLAEAPVPVQQLVQPVTPPVEQIISPVHVPEKMKEKFSLPKPHLPHFKKKIEVVPEPRYVPPVRKEVKKTSSFKPRRLLVRTFAMAVVVAAGYGAFQFVHTKLLASPSNTGTVAGVSTEVASPAPTMDTYAQSFVDLPFIQTEWSKVEDSDFGISFEYPKNTSNLVRTVGGNNIWVLRKTGVLMKISRIDSTLTLDAWWIGNQTDYTDGKTISLTTFKGLPAYYAESKAKTSVSTSSYFVKRTDGIYQISIKDEPAVTDDGQRLTHMIDTFTFTK